MIVDAMDKMVIIMVELNCDICGKAFKRKPCKIGRAEKHYCSNLWGTNVYLFGKHKSVKDKELNSYN